MKNVLVIEDEQNVAAFIKKGLNELDTTCLLRMTEILAWI